jgi:fanconi-associated nuclease 1
VRSKKRAYGAACAIASIERTPYIWPSRQALLDYEEVLELEAEVDGINNNVGVTEQKRTQSIASRTSCNLVTPPRQLAAPGPGVSTPRSAKRIPRGSSATPFKIPNSPRQFGQRDEKENTVDPETEESTTAKPNRELSEGEKTRKQCAEAVKEIAVRVLEQWQDLLAVKEEDVRPRGLERFECGECASLLQVNSTNE